MQNNQKIPEGWSVKKLGDFMIFKNGLNAEKGSYGSGIKFVNTMDIFNNTYLYEKNVIGSVNVNERKRNENSVIYGDVLFNRTSEIPEEIACSSVYLDTSKITFGGFIIRGRPKSNILSPKFSVYCFKSGYFRKEAIRMCQGAIRSNIGQEDLSKIFLLLPPLIEQEKIAGILGTWDEAIEKLSSLIEQKKNLKKGLMQRLLTGKTRLSGFTQPWKEVKLGEIADFISGYSFDSEDFKEEGIALIRISNIENDQIIIDNNTVFLDNSFIEKYQNYCLKPQDLLVAMSGATTGKMGVNKFNFPLLLNQRVGIIRAKNNNQCFINQYLIRFNNKILRMSYGGAQPNISSYDIKKIKLYIPSDITEQQAIADVLSTADEEIDLLNKKLEALKEQKKGLMQQLLTGQTRVKVN